MKVRAAIAIVMFLAISAAPLCMAAPRIRTTDENGVDKWYFYGGNGGLPPYVSIEGEIIYVAGEGFTPNSMVVVSLVTSHWQTGSSWGNPGDMLASRSIETDSNGNFGPTAIYHIPPAGYVPPGWYDYGSYVYYGPMGDFDVKVTDATTGAVIAFVNIGPHMGIFIVPDIPLGTLGTSAVSLVGLLLFMIRKKAATKSG